MKRREFLHQSIYTVGAIAASTGIFAHWASVSDVGRNPGVDLSSLPLGDELG
ncbi:MAG TPA: hypothetical protein PLQ35_00020 [bacterium]|nr:hypothetical protein [bacterium]HQL60653.1 hypothetical protein [bacterium]